MTTSSDTELLTVAEAAQILKVSIVTLHRWLKQGRLPACHVGPRAVRIRRGDLEQVMTPLPRPAAPAAPTQLPGLVPAIRPLTEEERQRGLRMIEESRKLRARMRARNGGKPLAESWPMINEAREERSKQI